MPKEKVQLATMSLVVPQADAKMLKHAAMLANMPFSRWAYTTLLAQLAPIAQLNEARTWCTTMEEHRDRAAHGTRGTSKGATGHLSICMHVPDHIRLKKAALSIDVTPHAFAHAVLMHVAHREASGASPGANRIVAIERQRAERAKEGVPVSLPFGITQELDTIGLAARVVEMIEGMPQAIMDGHGKTMKAGIEKSAASMLDESAKRFNLPVDEPTLAMTARFLMVPTEDLLRAVCMRLLTKEPGRFTGRANLPPLRIIHTEKTVRDNRGNRATIKFWGGIEAAEASLRSLEDCSGCIDCDHCVGCTGCRQCHRCKNCKGCDACKVCVDSELCVNCNGVNRCKHCHDCGQCHDCDACARCKNCVHCTGAEDAEHVVREAGE